MLGLERDERFGERISQFREHARLGRVFRRLAKRILFAKVHESETPSPTPETGVLPPLKQGELRGLLVEFDESNANPDQPNFSFGSGKSLRQQGAKTFHRRSEAGPLNRGATEVIKLQFHEYGSDYTSSLFLGQVRHQFLIKFFQ